MQARDIVKHRKSGAVGVVVATISMLREDGPLSVISDESRVARVIENESEYEIIGRYDAVPDERGCGMGQGDQCCRFLGVDPAGLGCLRFGDMHWSRVFSGGRELRDPARIYPNCKLS